VKGSSESPLKVTERKKLCLDSNKLIEKEEYEPRGQNQNSSVGKKKDEQMYHSWETE